MCPCKSEQQQKCEMSLSFKRCLVLYVHYSLSFSADVKHMHEHAWRLSMPKKHELCCLNQFLKYEVQGDVQRLLIMKSSEMLKLSEICVEVTTEDMTNSSVTFELQAGDG